MHRLLFSLIILLSGTAQAAVCTVPGAHPTLQAAIDDGNCSDIQFGPGEFEGSLTIARSLNLSGSGSGNTNLRGTVSVGGNGSTVYAQGFKVSEGCLGSWLTSNGGASLWGTDVVVELSFSGQCPTGNLIFKHGFEDSP